jgi:ATP-binding cassette subfamily C protein
MLAGALAEGFGLLMIVPLATIALHGSNSALFRYAAWAAPLSQEQRFALALTLFVGAMALRSVLLFSRNVLLSRLQTEYQADLRLRAAATLAGRGWPFASGIGQAGMQSLLLNDVPRAAEAAAYMEQMAVGATMLIVQLALTLLLSPALTLVAFVILALGWLVSVRFALRGVRSGAAIVTAMENSAGSGFRLHAGLKAALAQGTVAAFLEEYRSTLDHATAQLTKFARDYTFVEQAAALGAAIAAALLLLVGVRFLDLPFPVLIASLALFARMTAPAQLLQNSAVRVSAYAPAFAAIELRLGRLEGSIAAEQKREPLKWSRLELNAVGYEHQPGLGLKHAALRLKRGEWLGIEGPSGSGKTTLMDVVAGLLPPQTGEIRIDGVSLSEMLLERWRATLAYVGQESSVFNDSVRANLLAEGARADDEELWEVLRTVGLAERVRAFSRGLEESVGDRGSQLSGGERQRLVLARALLRHPTLLILDEATAALDPDSEAALLDRLKVLQPRPAALLVAHRESTLRHCDSLLSIRHGVVNDASQRNTG